MQEAVRPAGLARCYFRLPQRGLMSRNTSKFMRGIGRESTDWYSSFNRFLTESFTEKYAQLNVKSFSSEASLM